MSASRNKSPIARGGFSLVELLVALVFLSLLMAGMFKVWQASMSQFMTSQETLGIQRSSRWALMQLQDDLLQAGYLLPPRIPTELIGSGQPPLMIETSDTPLDYTKDSKGNEIYPDELQIVMDLPLNVEGTLTAAPIMGNSVAVTISSGGSAIKPGDLLFIEDSASEFFTIDNPITVTGSSFTFTLKTMPALVDQYGNDRASLVSPSVQNTHMIGAPVTFIRPMQVVSYTLADMSLDPSDNDAKVPCLVRRVKSLADASFGDPVVLVEGVSGLNLDWSLDGGKTWIRKQNNVTDKQWSEIHDKTNAVFTTSGSPLTQQLADYATAGIDSTTDPFWFNYIPVLIKMDVETRTRIQRTEYNAQMDPTAPAADYKTRRESILISSRNFGQGAP